MTDNYHIIPKPDSPYAALDLPAGIPVCYPLPLQKCGDDLIFSVDLESIEPHQLDALAKIVATARDIDVDAVIDGINAEGKFGICLHHVDRVVGDPKIAAMSMYEVEGMARAYRAKLLLERSPVNIILCMSLLDATAIYSALGQAVWILGSNDPKSESAELVGNWLDTVPPSIAQYAPELAQILIDKQEEDGDIMLAQLNAIDPKLEIKVPVGAYTAYLAIACLQLISRNPESSILPNIRQYIRTLSAGVLQLAPEVNWLIERGWHPEFDGGAG